MEPLTGGSNLIDESYQKGEKETSKSECSG